MMDATGGEASADVDYPHRRYNPLLDRWLIVAGSRIKRPWKGIVEPPAAVERPSFDANNPLCPGVRRPNGQQTPRYDGTYVFTNDFPALVVDAPPPPPLDDDALFRTAPARGTCRVMCLHPRSDLQLATMALDDIGRVVDTWIEQMRELGDRFVWVQIFENKGQIIGCSNPHPHCQIWASEFMPQDVATKDATQLQYWRRHGRPMLLDYGERELRKAERVVACNDHWLLLVPFWALWPYETMLLPRRHVARLTDLAPDEKRSLAQMMKLLLTKYDNLFGCDFPYSMGWHGAPTGERLTDDCAHWQLHAVYLPPLLRSATVKKFMAGYELVCEPQRDLTPEYAAARLRAMSDVHFTLATT